MSITLSHVLPELADSTARAAVKIASPLIVFAATESRPVRLACVALIVGYVVGRVTSKRGKRASCAIRR